MFLSRDVGTNFEPKSSAKTTSTLNSWAIFSAHKIVILPYLKNIFFHVMYCDYNSSFLSSPQFPFHLPFHLDLFPVLSIIRKKNPRFLGTIMKYNTIILSNNKFSKSINQTNKQNPYQNRTKQTVVRKIAQEKVQKTGIFTEIHWL